MTRFFLRTARAALAASVVSISLITLSSTSEGQESTGRIVGRIIDASSGRGLSDAGVQVVGTTLGALSQLDGRYVLPSVPSGTVTLQVRLLGYRPKTITGIFLSGGGTLEQNVALEVATVQLQAQVVTADAERGSVSAALDEQKNSTGILSTVTSEEISRSTDSDAAAAIKRVSGVTVQDGKFVFVRGLGERYTATTLNGARLPSPEPEKKVVPLDLFPAALLQSITTSKTFTADQPGDFSGALVNVSTREFPASRQVFFSSSVGYNDATTGKTVVAAPREGLEWLGFAGDARLLPGLVRSAGSFEPQPSPSEVNQIVSSFRNTWSATDRTASPNSSFSASVGGNDPVLGRHIGYIGSFTYSHSQEIRADEVRAYPSASGDREIDRFEGNTGTASVLWGGLANLSTLIGSRTRISFNNTYNRTADNEARRETGVSENHGAPLVINRLRFVERSVRSSQLELEHQLGERHRVSWTVNSSGVTRKEPDRSEFVYIVPSDATGTPLPPEWITGAEGAVRTFGDLDETNLGGTANYSFQFGSPGRQHIAKVGGLVQRTSRDAETRSYSIQGLGVVGDDRRLKPEEVFDGRFTSESESAFLVSPLSQGGSYTASDNLAAGYGMLEYSLTARWHLIAGARMERSRVVVDAEPTVGAAVRTSPTYTDVLPSLAANFLVTPHQNLRFSLSQTLARPEYRELSPIQYRDVIGGEVVQGNADLRRTLIQNADIRWEWYPGPSEALSLGVFAKRFENPIERIYLGTSGTRVATFLNADKGENYGVEAEARKDLGFIAGVLQPFSVFANATAMRSRIQIGSGSQGNDTIPDVTDDRPMVGQAPYVVNAGLTYAAQSGKTSATVLYNVVGRRIVSAAEFGLPNVYEESRNVVDLSLRFPVFRSVSGKLDLKNVLNEPYHVTQGVATREYFRGGRVITAGLTWRQ